MKLESIATILDFSPFETRIQAEPTHNLGERVQTADQRLFAYFKAGASDTAAGKLKISPAKFTTWDNMAVTAVAAGGTTINITLGATNNLAANALAEGYIIISDGPGAGQVFKVRSNPAIALSTAGDVQIYDPVVVALTTSSKASLVLNDYNGSIEGTTQTARPAGVSLIAVLAGDYGWLQTKGIASCLVDQTCALGNTYIISGSVAGAVTIGSTTYATFQATWSVGKAVTAGVDTKYNPIFLNID